MDIGRSFLGLYFRFTNKSEGSTDQHNPLDKRQRFLTLRHAAFEEKKEGCDDGR